MNYLEGREEKKRQRDTVGQNGNIETINSPVSSVYRISVDIGDVHVPNVVIDSGAVTNVIAKNTLDQFTRSNIKDNACCSEINLFAYGSDKPLHTLDTFTARVVCSETNRSCIADFVVIDGSGANLLGNCTAENLGVLHVGLRCRSS